MNRTVNFARISSGSLILLAFGVLASELVPLYFRNLSLQRYLEATVQKSGAGQRPEDLMRADIVNKAAQLNLPVRSDQVRLKQAGGRTRVEILYVVPVDFWIYSVDLHFHPRAGRL